jgi:hypothetical protein
MPGKRVTSPGADSGAADSRRLEISRFSVLYNKLGSM